MLIKNYNIPEIKPDMLPDINRNNGSQIIIIPFPGTKKKRISFKTFTSFH